MLGRFMETGDRILGKEKQTSGNKREKFERK